MRTWVLGWRRRRPRFEVVTRGSNSEGATMALPVRRTTSVSPQPLQRWEPFRELEQLQEHMGRLMQGVWSPAGGGNGGVWIPVTDIEETDDAWLIEAELPGVDRKDV